MDIIVRNIIAWMARRMETGSLKPIDKALLQSVSESQGRNESKRTGGLERREIRGSSPRLHGENRINRHDLTNEVVYSGGVVATVRGQGRAMQLEIPSSFR